MDGHQNYENLHIRHRPIWLKDSLNPVWLWLEGIVCKRWRNCYNHRHTLTFSIVSLPVCIGFYFFVRFVVFHACEKSYMTSMTIWNTCEVYVQIYILLRLVIPNRSKSKQLTCNDRRLNAHWCRNSWNCQQNTSTRSHPNHILACQKWCNS